MNRDMTVGSPTKILIRFSVPLLGSVIFQQLYNLADSVIAGKFSGENALAAIGASYPITMIFMAIAFGINMGCQVVVSNLFGAKDYKRLKTAASTTFLATLALTVVLTAVGLIFGTPMLIALGTPEEILGEASLYLNVYVLGLLFLFFYNIANGIFTALGDSATPLYFLIASSLGNILLDYIFVAAFHWGVAGVAWATFIAQGIAATVCFSVLLRRLQRLPGTGYKKFSVPMLGTVCKMALPSVLQQSFISVGNLFIQTLVNDCGTAAVAGFSAAMKLNTVATSAITNLAGGVSAYTAQNLGGNQPGRIKKGWMASMGIAAVAVAVITGCYLCFPAQLLSIFFDTPDAGGIGVGVRFLTIVSPFYIIIASKLVNDGILRGAGRMGLFMIATFTDLGLRVLFAFLLVKGFGMGADGIWFSWPIGWTISAIVSMIFYLTGIWKPKSLRIK